MDHGCMSSYHHPEAYPRMLLNFQQCLLAKHSVSDLPFILLTPGDCYCTKRPLGVTQTPRKTKITELSIRGKVRGGGGRGGLCEKRVRD